MALDDGINNFSQSPALVLSRLKASFFCVCICNSMKAKLFCRASHDGSWSSLYVCSWYSSWNPPMISPVCGQNMLKPQKWNLDYISPYIDHILFIMLDVHAFVNWYVWMSIWIHNPLTGVIMYITSVVMIFNSHITAIIAVKKILCVCLCVCEWCFDVFCVLYL